MAGCINRAKRDFWESLNNDGKQAWLDFYREAQEVLGAEFCEPFVGTQADPFPKPLRECND